MAFSGWLACVIHNRPSVIFFEEFSAFLSGEAFLLKRFPVTASLPDRVESILADFHNQPDDKDQEHLAADVMYELILELCQHPTRQQLLAQTTWALLFFAETVAVSTIKQQEPTQGRRDLLGGYLEEICDKIVRRIQNRYLRRIEEKERPWNDARHFHGFFRKACKSAILDAHRKIDRQKTLPWSDLESPA